MKDFRTAQLSTTRIGEERDEECSKNGAHVAVGNFDAKEQDEGGEIIL